MNNTDWKSLIHKTDLTDEQLRMIPFSSNENTSIMFDYCVKHLHIDEHKLLDGISVDKNYIYNQKRWINGADGFQFHKNMFKYCDDFLHHTTFYKIGHEFLKSQKSIPILMISFLSVRYILDNIVKFTRFFNNTLIPETVKINKTHYYILLSFYPYINNNVLGHECRFIEGGFNALLKIMGIETYSSKHILCDKKIKNIIDRIYYKYNWQYKDDGQYFYINGQKTGKHIQLKKLNINDKEVYINEIDHNSDKTNAIIIIKDFYYNNHCIFKRDEIYDAPYCLIDLTWEDKPIYKRFFNTIQKYFNLSRITIRELENQIEFTNIQLFKLQEVSEELRQEKNSLEQKVLVRTTDLKEANEKLLEFDKLKTDFYTNITHELRTPLTLVKSQVEAIQQGHFGNTINNDSDILKSISRNAHHLSVLIDNILDFSKIESKKMNIDLKETDLSEIATLIISNIESAAKNKNLTCEFFDNTHNLFVNLDQRLFEKAIYNLLINAIKFTPSGGHISLILDEDEKNILISVKDTGIGISKDKQEIIFERFRQADSSTTRKYEGTGIGLTLTKEIVEIHKGHIEVHSELDKGSTFTIAIPKNLENQKEKETDIAERSKVIKKVTQYKTDYQCYTADNDSETKSDTKIKSFTILIVEDNDDLRSFLKTILNPIYNVCSAKNGSIALSQLKQLDIDLILADIMMPELDGIELLKYIRTDKHLSWIPVIMLTARADFPMKMKGFSHGANDYIIKPFQPDELLARVRSQFSLVKLRREYKIAIQNKNEKIVTDKTAIAIKKVKKYIENNFLENISRENLSSIVDMSPDHLSRMFNKQTGMKIRDFINELKIKNILNDLRNNEKRIIDIAFDAGFESISSFNRAFQNFKKISPNQYRKSHLTNT